MVEPVFQWPGLGLLVIQSIQFADVPLLAAYLVMIALGFAVLNLWSICSTRRSIRACAPADREGTHMAQLHPPLRALVGQRSRLRFPPLAGRYRGDARDNRADRCAIGANVIAPINVNDPAAANVIDARLPPGSSGMFGGYFRSGPTRRAATCFRP